MKFKNASKPKLKTEMHWYLAFLDEYIQGLWRPYAFKEYEKVDLSPSSGEQIRSSRESLATQIGYRTRRKESSEQERARCQALVMWEHGLRQFFLGAHGAAW